MRRAAGIAFVTPERSHVLLAERADWLDSCPGTWAAPGGGIEGDESRFDAALREVEEEIGLAAKQVLARACFFSGIHFPGKAPFTLFLAEIDPSWVARNLRLNNENKQAVWFPIRLRHPPENMHPTMRRNWDIFCDEALYRDSECADFGHGYATISFVRGR